MTVDLRAYGWTEQWAASFAPYASEGLTPARVALEHTHIYRVICEHGELLARVAGRLRHQAAGRTDFPVVGDWVAVESRAGEGAARVRAVLPRTTRFSRRAAGDPTEQQVIAANIDVVFLVAGLDHNFNLRRLERYLFVARESGAAPVIVLNKADLVDDVHAPLSEVRALAPEVAVHAVSCRRPETLEAVRRYVGPGTTAALLGSSGVGKSTIANRLLGADVLRTQDVRADDSRGRHTSTNRQLVLMPGGGLLIDTPGMRELQLWDTGSLADTFTDVRALAEDCRFRDCSHRQEPGCAVTAAVRAGSLPASRHESFLKLAGEQAHAARQQEQRAQIEAKRRARVGSKALHRRIQEKRRT